MNPMIKKAAAALAIKEVIDRVQEARAPKKSFVARNKGKALWAGALAGGAYLYKNGKLDAVVSRVKGLAGRNDSSGTSYSSSTSPAMGIHEPVAEPNEAERPLETSTP